MESTAPTMLGDEILAHPQKYQRLQNLSPSEMLEDSAKSMAARLGEGMEDVSFREFVDLVLSISGRTSALSLMVEQDIANRKSSILRKVYFSSLDAKMQDPPSRDDPPIAPYAFTKSPSMNFPDDENEDTCCKPQPLQMQKMMICGDQPPPMESESRASTHTSSSWSSVSDFDIMDQTGSEYFSGSFQFVSEFDDGEESLSTNDSGEKDDRSMLVFLEKEQERVLQRKSVYTPAITTTNNPGYKIELPHDFEVVTIVDVSGNDSLHLGRTYSVTTSTTSAHSRRGRSVLRNQHRISNRLIHRLYSSLDAETATEATSTAELEQEAMEKPLVVREPERSRSGATVTTTLSNTFRKIRRIRSKSTGSF